MTAYLISLALVGLIAKLQGGMFMSAESSDLSLRPGRTRAHF